MALRVRVPPLAFLNLSYSEKAHDTSTSCAFCFVVVLTERVGGFRGIRGGVDSDGLTAYRYRTEKTLTVLGVRWYCVENKDLSTVNLLMVFHLKDMTIQSVDTF